MATYIWNLKNLAVSFFGLNFEGGFGSGGAVKVEVDGPKVTVKKGVDGSVTFCATGNSLVKVTLTFDQQADANNLLAGIQLADELAPNGLTGVLNIEDNNGAYRCHSPAAKLEGHPATQEFTQESKDREWVIWAAEATVFCGGSFTVVGSV